MGNLQFDLGAVGGEVHGLQLTAHSKDGGERSELQRN